MKELINLLKEKETYLQQVISNANVHLANAPEGRLVIKNRSGIKEYYQKNPGDNGHDARLKYISKSDTSLITSLAQKSYNSLLLRESKKQLSHVSNALKIFSHDTNLSDVYGNLSPQRKELINPLIPDDEEFVKRWENAPYKSGIVSKDSTTFETERGETVRSKSEKILADKFYLMKIPYRYEYEITFRDGQVKWPDFMLLNIRTRKEFFWEHAGRMDDPGYGEDFTKKMNLYEMNGIIPGRNLILTFESSRYPLNMRVVENLIREYLL